MDLENKFLFLIFLREIRHPIGMFRRKLRIELGRYVLGSLPLNQPTDPAES